MINDIKQTNINAVMKIWLDGNIAAHHFIPEQYWVDNYNVVKEKYLPIAKTLIYEEDCVIQGFISIIEGFFIGALFVAKEYQKQGVGIHLINYCKGLYPKLALAAYVDNIGAVKFYERCDFKIQAEQVNSDSGFKEYIMVWNKK
jgi:putative acetyltransferase